MLWCYLLFNSDHRANEMKSKNKSVRKYLLVIPVDHKQLRAIKHYICHLTVSLNECISSFRHSTLDIFWQLSLLIGHCRPSAANFSGICSHVPKIRLCRTLDITPAMTAGTVDPSMQTELQFEATNHIAKQGRLQTSVSVNMKIHRGYSHIQRN